jgi:threonine dehydrogenase-like Zn-dependent dehydrogenase
MFATEIRRKRVNQIRSYLNWQWHLDEVFVKINGETHYLWQAVDHEGEVLMSDIRGFVWEELLEGYNNAPHSTFSGFKKALKWLGEGRVDLSGLVHRTSPNDPPALYAAIQERQIKEPFIVINWREV